MKQFLIYSLLLFLSFIPNLGSITSAQPSCTAEIRAAFDIGSGKTKMTVAEVDPCLNLIRNTLRTEQIKIAFKDSLTNKNFSEEIMATATAKLKPMLNSARLLGAKKFSAVATAAFREATNANTLAQRLNDQLKLNVHIVSQKEEARLGFSAVTKNLENPPNKLVVWDIGGGSQQLTSQNKKQDLLSYEGQLASISFKDLLIEKIQKKDPKISLSPNPISSEQLKQATDLATEVAIKTTPQEIKLAIQEAGGTVFGISGVHSQSIKKQLGNIDSFNLNQLESALKTRAGLSDTQIGGNFAATEVSNLALVYGFMKGLGIQRVVIKDLNLSDALLLEPSYWSENKKTTR